MGAFFYLTACSMRNRVKVKLRRLREPRYLLGSAVGFLYVGMIFRPGGPPSRLLSTWRANGQLENALCVLLFGIIAWAWIGSRSRRAALAVTRAELLFLIPAPVRRRQLIRYKVLRSQVSIAVSAAILTIFRLPDGPAGALAMFAGLWLVLATINTHLMGVVLNLGGIAGNDLARGSRRWLPLTLVTAAVVIVGVTIASDWPRLSTAATSSETARELQRITATGPAAVVLWPFRTIARVSLARSAGELLSVLPGALVLLVLNAFWVLRSDAVFEDGSVDIAERSGHAGKGLPSLVPGRSRPRTAPFALAPAGHVETAILWKNLILAGWRARMSTLAVAIAAVVIGAIAVSSAGGAATSQTAGAMCTLLAAGVILLGPTMIRSDLRHDLAHLAVLKTWPVTGAALVRGEILAPALVLSLFSSALLACGAAVSGGPVYDAVIRTGASRISLAAAAIVAAAAIITVHLIVHNAVALIFPSWARIGAQPAGGVEMMGQNMLVMVGTVIALAVAMVPAAIVAGIGALVISIAAGAVPIVLPAALFAAVVLLECLAATAVLGRVLDRTDGNTVGSHER